MAFWMKNLEFYRSIFVSQKVSCVKVSFMLYISYYMVFNMLYFVPRLYLWKQLHWWTIFHGGHNFKLHMFKLKSPNIKECNFHLNISINFLKSILTCIILK